MSISPKHSLKSKKDRRFTSVDGVANTQIKNFLTSDEIVEKVYVDICSGVSRRDCQKKLSDGLYGNKPISLRQSQFYYKAALDQLADNTDLEAKRLKDVLFTRYEKIFEEAMKKGDIFNARATLDSMAKIFGLEQKTPQTQVNIQNNSDTITISFGFENDDKQIDNVQDVEIIDEE